MKYVLGLDLGTSSLKAVLYDVNLKEIISYNKEYPVYFPENGWSEQDPVDWTNALDEVISELKDFLKDDIENLCGIGLTGQMHGLVMLDEKNEVIRPAILWSDQRTEKECIEIEDSFGKENLISITANPALTGFTLPKILWVKNNERENFDRCRHILLPKDYIRFYLTKDYATDVSDASGMQLLNVEKRQWSNEIVEFFGIDKSLLPKVYESICVTGYTKENIFGHKVPVIAGAGDNAAAGIGTCTINDGDSFTTVGTSGVVFTQSDSFKTDPNGRLHSFCAAVPNTWHLMGVTQAAGFSIQWMRENFFKDLDDNSVFDYIESNISNIKIGSDRLIFLPYLMGERTPILDPNARGVFFGLSGSHSRENIARSVYEGVAFSLRNSYDLIKDLGIDINTMRITGGGASSNILCQMICDNYNHPIEKIKETNGTTLGVAILTLVSLGFYEDIQSAVNILEKNDIVFYPNVKNYEKYNDYYEIYNNLYLNLKDEFRSLQNIEN